MNTTLRNIFLPLLSGVLLGLSWLLPELCFLVFFALVPLLYLEQQKERHIFFPTLLAFVVWNTISTWWVWNSTPEGCIAMVIINSLLMTCIFCLYHRIRRRIFGADKGYFLLVIFVLTFEYLHYHWQLNWPWLTLGNALAPYHWAIQWYDITGVAGGSLWIISINILIFKMLGVDSDRRNRILAKLTLLLLIPLIFSVIRYFSYSEKGEAMEVAVIQPNIDPYTEEFTLSDEEMMNRNLNLAEQVMTSATQFVVSPESAIQEGLWLPMMSRSYCLHRIQSFLKAYPQAKYVIGASVASPTDDCDDFAAVHTPNVCYFNHNSALFVDTLSVRWRHKSRLTPGVEMMPSWWIVRPLARMAIDLGGTTGTLKGDDEIRVYDKVGALICYESVFGGYVRQFSLKGAEIFFVITNDGWWGNTPGHRQHLLLSKLRAIENRRSIARSANTGISAFINQRGDIICWSNYGETDALREVVTLNDKVTLYVICGDYLYAISAFFAVFFCILNLFFRFKKKK